MPKVSVIVPIYNARKYLKQCLDSIVGQTLKDIEVILIDDGSTDGSTDICKSYLYDNRVKYYYKENEGLAAARQDGIDRASGEYIGFVDSDDWCESNMFEKMYQAAKTNDSDIVFCNCYENIDKKNPKFYRSGPYNRKQIEEEIFPHVLISIDSNGKRHNARWCNWLRVYKNSMIKEHNISFVRKLRRCQDLQFTFECTIHAQNYYYLGDDYLYHNRQEGGSLSRGYTKQMWTLIKPLIQRIVDVADSYIDYDFKPLSKTTAFFLIADCILNELKIDAPPLTSQIKHINEIVNDPLCKKYINSIDGSNLNFFWKPIYECAKTRHVLRFLLKQKWSKSWLNTKVATPFINWVFRSECLTNIYVWVRHLLNRNYSVKR